MSDGTDDRMPAAQFNRRTMIAGGALIATSLLADVRRPDVPLRMMPKSAKLDDLIPKQIGNWTYEGTNGLVLPPPDQLGSRLYNGLLTRFYSSTDTLPVMLLIAYSGSQDGVLQVHRPEVCYPAAGYDLTDSHFELIDAGKGLIVPGHFLAARSNSRHEEMLYWTRIGNTFPTRWWQQHVAVAEENVKGRVPDGVLVRISTAASSNRDAIKVLRYFMHQLLPVLSPLARRVLFGERGAPLPHP
jgi:EpsI family protein